MNDLVRPEGIEPRHVHQAGGSLFRRWPFGLGGLGVLLGLAVFGVYGADARLTGAGNEVELVVEGPRRIRNGEFFEMVITIAAERDVRDLVILVDEELWRDLTVNTLLPDPSGHGFREGSFEFRFGALNAGERLLVKIDGQINPSHAPSTNAGTIALANGDAVLATVNYTMEVLP